MNIIRICLSLSLALLCPSLGAGPNIVVGQKLPEVTIAEKGVMVPKCKVANGRMVLESKEIGYRAWNTKEMTGRVCTVYHLAARMGIDDINKAYIDAIIAAKLPEFTPDAPYKTITVLNQNDALWGTRGLGKSRLEGSQRDVPHAIHVMDEQGLARAAWGLQPKNSAVIVLDKDGTVLFFKEGKLSPDEITKALAIIKDKLGLK